MTGKTSLMASAVLLFLSLLFFCTKADPRVYITATGTKYHTDSCSYLAKSKIPISLSWAVEKGYSPCSRCRPPVPKQTSTKHEKLHDAVLYRVNTADLSSVHDIDISRATPAMVVNTVDGDTVDVSIVNPPEGLRPRERIRLIGVDTPETVHPLKKVERFGKESSNFTRNGLLEKEVFLALDWQLWDAYGRLLAYVCLPNGSCFNAQLIEEGYGHAYTVYPFQFLEEFRELEQRARAEGRGLWADER